MAENHEPNKRAEKESQDDSEMADTMNWCILKKYQIQIWSEEDSNPIRWVRRYMSTGPCFDIVHKCNSKVYMHLKFLIYLCYS